MKQTIESSTGMLFEGYDFYSRAKQISSIELLTQISQSNLKP
jgi:hypothetical protein